MATSSATITDWVSASSAVVAALAAVVSITFSYRAKSAEKKAQDALRRSELMSLVLPKRDAYDQMVNKTRNLYTSRNYTSGAHTVAHIEQLNRATSMFLDIAKAEYSLNGKVASLRFLIEELGKVALAYPTSTKIEATWTLPKEVLDPIIDGGQNVNSPALQAHLGRISALEEK